MNNLDIYCVTNKRIQFLENSSYKLCSVGKNFTHKNYQRSDIKQNKGDKTFLKKWGITHKFFKKYYLKSRTPYKGPLNSPDKSAVYYFELIICKIKFFYSLIFKQSEKKWN